MGSSKSSGLVTLSTLWQFRKATPNGHLMNILGNLNTKHHTVSSWTVCACLLVKSSPLNWIFQSPASSRLWPRLAACNNSLEMHGGLLLRGSTEESGVFSCSFIMCSVKKKKNTQILDFSILNPAINMEEHSVQLFFDCSMCGWSIFLLSVL